MSARTGYPESMQRLIDSFSKMPGIGVRTAERLAYYVLGERSSAVKILSESIQKVKDTIRYCRHCFNLSEDELCGICNDAARQQEILCVVEQPKDIIAVEKAGAYAGLYHVLLGSLSPLDGIGPEDIKIPELLRRLKSGQFKEVIVATPSDTEGEATSLYLFKVLKPLRIKVTRIAQGVPMGAELEFADRATLIKAIEDRHEMKT